MARNGQKKQERNGKVFVGVYVDVDLHRRFREAAENDHRDVAKLLRKLLEDHVNGNTVFTPRSTLQKQESDMSDPLKLTNKPRRNKSRSRRSQAKDK